MTQPEVTLSAGSGANSSFRNGDYSAMTLDPEDDCTFWFTGMNNFTSNWRTHVGSFRFEACGCETEPPLPPVANAANNGDNRIDVTWDDSAFETTAEYRVRRSTTPGGPYETIATVLDTSPGVGGGPGYTYSDTTVSGGITYFYVVVASDGAACRSEASTEVAETAIGACLLEPLFEGVVSVTTPNSGICTLDVTWDVAIAPCGGPITYDVFRSTDPDFEPGAANRIAADVVGTTINDIDGLATGQAYTYLVRARDTGNGVQEQNDVRATAAPFGVIGGGTGPKFEDDAGDTGAAQLTLEEPWIIDPTGGNEGPNAYALPDYGNNLCARMTTPSFSVGSGDMLEFSSRFDIEPNWDKGVVEISVDGGNTWELVPMNYPDDNASNTGDACGYNATPAFSGSGTDWADYAGDLTAWAGNDAILRFSLSTDGSQTRTLGWVVDDIVVSSGAADCATGSTCEDNPFIDVVPNGALLECDGLAPELSVVLSGGNGPFEYQWTQDGQIILGANAPTFIPQALGTHRYNVLVRSQNCPDTVFDGNDTVITIENTPELRRPDLGNRPADGHVRHPARLGHGDECLPGADHL